MYQLILFSLLFFNFYSFKYLYINNIFLSNFNLSSLNFYLILEIKNRNIPPNIFIKDLFKIIIESENIQLNKTITFECDLFGPTNLIDTHIKCFSKDIKSSGSFFFF